ncbi:MAG: tRNA pseudouridine(38-40) synthase TruA [Verrucomicrobiota bacterium]
MNATPKIRNHKITIAYDGSAFQGWQRQSSAPTVQLAIENAIKQCWPGEKIVLHGSGRTDTGVHASGQVASFKAPTKFDLLTCLRALNNNLPQAVRILKIRYVPNSFHARFSAIGKEYLYKIYNHEIMPPLEINRYLHLPRLLDVNAMEMGASYLIGTHDFASYTSNPGYKRESTVRTIETIKFSKVGPRIHITFQGNGFLYRMVRNLVGAFVKVGHGRLDPVEIKKILENKKRTKAPATALPHGLYLHKVFY